MGQMQEKNKKIVSKVIVAIITLAMVLPASMLLVNAKPTGKPFELSAPIVDTFYKQNDIINLANAQFDVKVGPQNLASELVIEKYDERVSGYYLVKFNDAIDEYWVASLKAMGAKIGSYVPYNTYIVKMNADTLAEVNNLPYVRSVSIYQPAFRMAASLLQGVTLQPGMQSADALSYISWNNLYEQASLMGLKKDITAVTIMLQEGENSYDLAALISKTGGKVLGITENSVRAEISRQGVQALAFVNNVEYILPYFENKIMLADTAWTEQSKVTDSVPVWDKGIHGEGIVVGIADTGLDTDHDHFRQNGYTPYDWTGQSLDHRKVVGYHQLGDNKVDYDDHGSHVTGIAVGNGDYVGSTNVNKYGMAYEAKVSFCDIGKSDDGSGTNDATLGGIPQDLKTMYALQKADGASLSSNSWGVPCTYVDSASVTQRTLMEGKYTEDALNSDQYMWQNKEFQIFFSNGNDRTAVLAGGPAYNTTTTPPATAKNVISVGSHSAGAAWQTGATYSSVGPTNDGRLKPDISSTGIEDSADANTNRDGTATTLYKSMQGTSMASPCALGDGALVAQYYRDGWYPVTASSPQATNSFVPSNALIKATLINGARDTGTSLAKPADHPAYPYSLNGHTMVYPNGDAGWGAIDTGDSLYFSGETRKVWSDDNKAGLITNQLREYKVSIAAGTALEITLVWADFPGTVANGGRLMNDLDLTVIGPTGTVYYGNNYGATSRESDSTNPAGYDHINPVECALLLTPGAGTYTIRVNAITVPKGPQPFALVVAANFDDGYGWVRTDKMVYKPGDTLTAEVQDTNVGAAGTVDTVTVQMTSSTGDVETRTLTETAAASYRFTGTTDVDALTPVSGNGNISIENNGWISVKYTDADPAHDSYANVTTLMSSPKISNVYVTDISNTNAMVHWTTDVPATSQVFYGTTTSLGSSTTIDNDMVLTHEVAVFGLTGFTNYYFDVQSVSIGGVTTRDTNGGDHYMFTTIDNPDILIVQEHSDIASSDQQVDDWRLSLGYYGWSFAVWETVKYGLPTLAALNSAKAVYWDVGEGYPQLGGTERALIQSWLDQAGVQKWYQTGQDVGWDMAGSEGGPASTGTDEDITWFHTYLHATQRRDDTDGGGGNEVAGQCWLIGTAHAISNVFPGDGVKQDLEQDVYGSGRFWPDDISNNQGGEATPPWDYNLHKGTTPGDAAGIAYTGADYKLAFEAFAHAMIQDDNTYGTAGNVFGTDLNMDRATTADNTIKWLMGEDHPDVTVLNNNGQVEDGTWSGTQTITWTIANADSQSVQISKDGGQSYLVEATGLAGTATSYVWDTTTVTSGIPDYPNGVNYKIKILAQGTNLKGFDVSDEVFTIDNGAAGDKTGPVIVAGSIKVDPLPSGQGNTITFDAEADDTAKGYSNIAAAEYRIDLITNPATAMTATDLAFNEKIENITGTYVANIAQGSHIVFIRAQDAAGNWGGYEQFTFQVNEGGPSVQVTAPNTAENIISGSYAITWTATDYTDAAPTLDCKIEYSANGGSSWVILENLLDNNDGTYTWDTTSVADNVNYLVRVTATDSFPLSGDDICDFVFSVDNVVNDRWYLQMELTGSNYQLNMAPVDIGTFTEPTGTISAVGQQLVGTWQTNTITGTSIDGTWTFNLYGTASANLGTANLYAKVFKSSDMVTPLDTTVNDDENIFSFTNQHLFTWTDTLAGTFPSGESLVVEVWVDVTSVLTTATYNYVGVTAASGPHDAYTLDMDDSTQAELTTPNSRTEFTDVQYTEIETSNNVDVDRASAGWGDEIGWEFRYAVTEAPAAITSIDLTFEGQWAAADCIVTCFAWNAATSNWDTIGATMTFTTADTDYTMTRTISATPANYISGGILRMVFYGSLAATASKADFAQAVVHLTPSATVSVDFDYVGAQSNIEPTISGGGGTPYAIDLTGKAANSWIFVSFPSAMSGNIETILDDAAAGDNGTNWTVAKTYDNLNKKWLTYRVG
ncbi:MAG: S8 family serine peptidase, partial [Thermoplasmata archaeon]|nr:S8 family serine peptidase [Thermoplasmata archaeon]